MLLAEPLSAVIGGPALSLPADARWVAPARADEPDQQWRLTFLPSESEIGIELESEWEASRPAVPEVEIYLRRDFSDTEIYHNFVGEFVWESFLNSKWNALLIFDAEMERESARPDSARNGLDATPQLTALSERWQAVTAGAGIHWQFDGERILLRVLGGIGPTFLSVRDSDRRVQSQTDWGTVFELDSKVLVAPRIVLRYEYYSKKTQSFELSNHQIELTRGFCGDNKNLERGYLCEFGIRHERDFYHRFDDKEQEVVNYIQIRVRW